MEKGIRYSDFLGQVEKRILDFMPEKFRDCRVHIEEIEIGEGTIEILGLFKDEAPAVPGISLRNYFKEFLGCWNMDKILKEIAEDYRKLDIEMRVELETGHKVTEEEMELFDFEKMKDKICFRLMNYNANRDFLEISLHERCMDFAKVYYIVEAEDEKGISYRCIPNVMLDEWGVTLNEVDKAASENTPKYFAPALYEAGELSLFCENGVSAVNYLKAGRLPDAENCFVLTNERKRLGAGAIMYPEVLQQIWDMMGKDFYVVPISIDEVIIMPKDRMCKAERIIEAKLISDNKHLPSKYLLSNTLMEYTNEDLMLLPVQRDVKEKIRNDYER
ncbi:MAG: hypothetical protein IJB73_09520 [Firmicutes bacterium]|nr:hypothetical protein [Bacillota bacterium]